MELMVREPLVSGFQILAHWSGLMFGTSVKFHFHRVVLPTGAPFRVCRICLGS